jgi:hypothetical protein
VTDPLTAADDRGTTYRWVGAEPVGSSTNLYAKFAPAPPAGATINVEIATAYLSSDDAWYGKLTLP